MSKRNKPYSNSDVRNILFCELGIGIFSNGFLLLFHVLMCIRGHRPRLTDLAISLLTLLHLLVLAIVVLQAKDILISWERWDDVTCKSVNYLYRCLRGLSICTASMLSVLQAVTLSPQSSCLAKFKPRSLGHVLCPFLLLGVLYTSMSSNLLISIITTPNWTSQNLIYVSESCSLSPLSSSSQYVFSTLWAFRETLLISVMVLSSSYMVALLLRHKKQSRHLQTTQLSPRVSPEQRATRTILLLMSLFVVLCILDSIIAYSRTVFQGHPVFFWTHILVSSSYATFSPLVIISNERHIINFLRFMWKRKVNT